MKTFKQFSESISKVYYRGTNNKNEPHLLKKGKLKPSTNLLTNTKEKGLSVSDILEPIQQYYDFVYRVTGKEIGIGSDGEPLLKLDSVKFVDWVKPSDKKSA